MGLTAEFDEWADEGRDRSMEERHWHTAKHALAAMPVESSDTVLDLGTGSGYALRALDEVHGLRWGIGIDASGRMLHNAASYTSSRSIHFVQAAFEAIPVANDRVDHVFSMEAFYYARDPSQALAEVYRILKPGGTFHCAVNFFTESTHTHAWDERIPIDMTLWSREEYRQAFTDAGFDVVRQTCIPDEEIEIPPADQFPTDDWDSRAAMVDRYRRWGTLVTVGIAGASS